MSGRLFQEFVVDAWACTEQENLRYCLFNQPKLRGDLYKGLQDALRGGADINTTSIGKRIILPSTHANSPRQMHQLYQDALSTCRHHGPPDIFPTFTCNPHWPEIQENLLFGQDATDRPDIVSRVFKLKLEQLLDDILKRQVLGKVAAHVYTIEFQKRCLPHAHILLILDPDSKLRTTEDIDSIVCAEIPNPDTDPILYETVANFMLHGPCGDRCMSEGKCKKGYPRPFRDETTADVNGYPLYRRRDNGRFIEKNGVRFDNRHVVPYNPYLCAKYNAHINVEICTSIRAVKYLYKYVYKGHDRAAVAFQQNEDDNNEVKQYLEGRYVGPCEATWRLFQHKTHRNYPPVTRLQLHLPDQQFVTFSADANLSEVVQSERLRKTSLTEYFATNLDCQRRAAQGEILPFDSRTLLYTDFPTYYTWTTKSRSYRWNLRRYQNRASVGRLYFAGPSAGERYYLRMLLTTVRGATSFEHLRTVNGHTYSTFKEACVALGLLDTDDEWHRCLREAAIMQTGRQLRELLVCILLNCEPANPLSLWTDHVQYLTDDCHYILQNQYGIAHPTEDQIHSLALCRIAQLLKHANSDLDAFRLPHPTMDFDDWRNRNTLIWEERNYDVLALQQRVQRQLPMLNDDQKAAATILQHAVNDRTGGMFFVDGPGGTGKTFLQNFLLAYFRSKGKIALAVASSGIAATLLDGGRTAHSRFKIPLDIDFQSTCDITINSLTGELIRDTDFVFWDEAPMQSRHVFEAVDRTFQDVRQDDRAFGGVVMCFCGDFRQILPVVPKASRAVIVNKSLKASPLWKRIKTLKLTINMRLNDPALSLEGKNQTAQFATWLLQVGEGTVQSTIPDHVPCAHLTIDSDNALELMVRHTYPPTEMSISTSQWLFERAILAARNEDVDFLNSKVLDSWPGEAVTFLSADTTALKEDRETYPTEYLNTITIAGLSLHKCKLKLGCPVILLRNLDPSRGLCNGTRLRIHRISPRVLEAEILGGSHAGTMVFIPRIKLLSSASVGLPFTLQRIQFPIRLAFAMTINKAQGQTLKHVGLDLRSPVFSHGQLYVALCRITNRSGLVIVVNGNAEDQRRGMVKNVVYNEVLQD